MGRGARCRYADDEPEAYAADKCYFLDDMPERRYYHPTDRGFEALIAERLRRIAELCTEAKRDWNRGG